MMSSDRRTFLRQAATFAGAFSASSLFRTGVVSFQAWLFWPSTISAFFGAERTSLAIRAVIRLTSAVASATCPVTRPSWAICP